MLATFPDDNPLGIPARLSAALYPMTFLSNSEQAGWFAKDAVSHSSALRGDLPGWVLSAPSDDLVRVQIRRGVNCCDKFLWQRGIGAS